MIEAVVFDFYDTLAYRDEEVTTAARSTIAERLGLPVARLNALWRERRDDRMLGVIPTLEDHLRLIVAAAGVQPAPETLAEVAALERQGQREAVHLYPSALAVLRQLRAMGFRLGLLSNSSDAADEPMHYLEMHRYFDDVVLSHRVGLLKPDPRIFLLACDRLGVGPERCSFVADGGFGELDEAHRLGMTAVKVVQPRQSKDYGSSEYGEIRINAIAELLPLAASWRENWVGRAPDAR